MFIIFKLFTCHEDRSLSRSPSLLSASRTFSPSVQPPQGLISPSARVLALVLSILRLISMANTTVRGALSIHGVNPQVIWISVVLSTNLWFLQSLVETVIRNRIYESGFWKEHCFALTGERLGHSTHCLNSCSFFVAESIIDQALELRCIGGVYGNQRPTEFLGLLLKLLEIQPGKEILVEYIQADEFK